MTGVLRDTCANCKKPLYFGQDPGSKRGFSIWRWRHANHHQTRCFPNRKDDSYPFNKTGMATPQKHCPVDLKGDAWSGHRTCNRPVKRNGMCGLHASHAEREEARDAQREEERALSDHVFSSTLAMQKELQDKYGIDSKTDYDTRSFEYTGMIVLNPAQLLSFLDEIFG